MGMRERQFKPRRFKRSVVRESASRGMRASSIGGAFYTGAAGRAGTCILLRNGAERLSHAPQRVVRIGSDA